MDPNDGQGSLLGTIRRPSATDTDPSRLQVTIHGRRIANEVAFAELGTKRTGIKRRNKETNKFKQWELIKKKTLIPFLIFILINTISNVLSVILDAAAFIQAG